jgi:hypothetical protein
VNLDRGVEAPMARRLRRFLACWTLVEMIPAVAALAQEVRVGAELQVNTYTSSSQGNPSVAADADGDVVVVWNSSNQDGSGTGIFARRLSAAGVFLAAEFQVNAFTPSVQIGPSVAAEAGGDFVVVWSGDSGQDGSNSGVFGRRVSSSGSPLATEFQVR